MTNDQLARLRTLLVVASIFVPLSTVSGEGRIFVGQVRGEQVERIDGSDHRVERSIGRPDARTVQEQLRQLNIATALEDRVEAFPDPRFGLGSAIRITRANRVTIVDAGQPVESRTWASSVGELLEQQQIQLGSDDQLDKNINDTIVDTMTITITRVQVTEIDEKESIAFTTVTVDDPTMDKGETKLIEKGKNGVRTKRFRVRRENGQLIEKELITSVLTTEPKTEKVARGTKTVVYGTGQATWYALKSGLGAAHNTLPKGTRVKVTNLANGKSVDVVINDHGIQGSAIIDLTKEAFERIAPLGAGRIQVKIEKDYD